MYVCVWGWWEAVVAEQGLKPEWEGAGMHTKAKPGTRWPGPGRVRAFM